jgi:serine/threonine protein kinase
MTVLLKRHRPEHANAAQAAGFRTEYRLLQSLSVAGVAKPLALIEERGCLAMPLEDFAGESLEAVLSRDSRMDLPVCLGIARHLADALAGIDAARVIHRDIRPANILVAPDIVHAIVTDAGGAIDVRIAVGQGSTFAVYLPLTGIAVDARASATSRTATPAQALGSFDEEPFDEGVHGGSFENGGER